MTIRSFMENLKKYGKPIEGLYSIRFTYKRGKYCPLCYICKQTTGNLYNNENFDIAASKMGIDYDLSVDIACAADSTCEDLSGRPLRLRKQMLKSLNLKEDSNGRIYESD